MTTEQEKLREAAERMAANESIVDDTNNERGKLDASLQCDACGRDYTPYTGDCDIYTGATCPSDDCQKYQ